MKIKALRLAAASAMLVASAVIVWSMLPGTAEPTRPAAVRPSPLGFAGYAGSQTCVTCHQRAHDTHVRTAHFLTSAPAERQRIKGSFEPGKNVVRLDGNVSATMSERDGRFFQDGIVDFAAQTSHPFDIVIGSGKKGQSFLYWDRDFLYQLPISYWVPSDGWINSPGFPRDELQFDRPIAPACLQCHSTYFEKTDFPVENQYDRARVIYGIDCERCHGPAADHVGFHLSHPEVKTPRHVVRIATLSRQQRLDVCAQCHSGVRESSIRPFSFRPGDSIAKSTLLEYAPADATQLDVHSNQYGLLTASKCFQASGTLTCTSCHAPHETRHDPILHSQKCLGCHVSADRCGLSHSVPTSELSNCIDCHMPNLASRNLRVQGAAGAKQDPLTVRTHRIAIYRAESDDVLKQRENGKGGEPRRPLRRPARNDPPGLRLSGSLGSRGAVVQPGTHVARHRD